ncbi:MAG: hypothetical protein ACTHJ7_00020 [Candidatus Nitrosocosmicus sp.]
MEHRTSILRLTKELWTNRLPTISHINNRSLYRTDDKVQSSGFEPDTVNNRLDKNNNFEVVKTFLNSRHNNYEDNRK